MKTFAELKADQVASNCRGQVRASHFSSLKSSNNLLATYRQISVQGDEPVFIKCTWSDNARAAALEARRNKSSGSAAGDGRWVNLLGRNVFMRGGNAVEHLMSHEGSGSDWKSFAASRKANNASAGATTRQAHLYAGQLHGSAAKASDHEDVGAYHRSMMGYHAEVARGGKASSERIKEEQNVPDAHSHKEASDIHNGLAAIHEKLGNTADAAFHRDQAKHHLQVHLNQGGIEASVKNDLINLISANWSDTARQAAAHINAENLKNEPQKPFWQESHPNKDWRGGFHED